MHRMPQPPRRSFPWRRHMLAFTAFALLAGCANGDFQEVQPTLVVDSIHDWVGRDAIGFRAKPSRYGLTDDERALRDLAYPLIEPPYDRQQWYSIAGEYGIFGLGRRGAFDRAAYWNRLVGTGYRSPAARYARLTDDIRDDTTRLPQFFETASRVLDIDAKRRKSLAYVSRLAPEERQNALRRIHENAAIVALVRAKLKDRVIGYRYALERLVIQTPSPRAADVEHYLNSLQTRIAYYSSHPVPSGVQEQSLASAR
jgi:hypothetical protein